MGFFKGKGKLVLTISFSVFLILQQIAVQYRRSYVSKNVNTDGYDTVALNEINQLEELWRKADVADLVTLEKIASPKQLELARVRLKQAEKGIQESENRVRKATGENREFFKNAHAYYRHSATALIDIVDFLLATKEGYSVQGNEIFFENESNAAQFRELVGKLSALHREKENLDTFILRHNREVEKKLLVQ